MPRLGTPLTDIAVRNAKASPQKARTLYDTGGLMLLIQPSGSKSWAGFYPEITDGCKRAENFWSCLATLRRILGLWNRSMYSNTSALAASSVG